MSDRIVLANLRFMGTHGVNESEQREPQPFEVDVELHADLRAAGASDALDDTVDYRLVYDLVREVIETRSYRLLERIAQVIAEGLLSAFDIDEVVVRVRKPAVQLGGPLDHAMVEVRRSR
jgi:7,8-dihydroneopterin aldolase/epimerase/oxygenase